MTATTTAPTRPACIATGCPELGVWVACLASHNAGRLHGAWIDLEDIHDADDIQEGIDWILTTSPSPGAEEWAIHDSCGLPGHLRRTEWPDLDQLAALADAIADLTGDDEREAYRLACDDAGTLLEADDFRDTYAGTFSSGEDYAMELAEETGALPQQLPWPLNSIDWASAWRELTFDGYRDERCSSGGVHIFRPA
jgi:antirestriction protein